MLSPSRMGLTNPGRALGQSLLLISRRLSTVWHHTHFHKLVSTGLLPCFARWTQSFLSDKRACVAYQNHKSHSFEAVEVFGKNPFLALYFFLFSSMIFWFLCLLPSAAYFTLTIWLFGPLPLWSPLRWRPYKELCFD